jgi:hypothetical protein
VAAHAPGEVLEQGADPVRGLFDDGQGGDGLKKFRPGADK